MAGLSAHNTNFRLAEAIEILASTPSVLDSLLRGRSRSWTAAIEGPDTWSPFDIVGHLIHGEETDWIPRAHIILSRSPDPSFKPFDRYAQFTRFEDADLGEMLDRFAEIRAENLDTLHSWDLSEEQLALPGRHPELGPVTLHQLLATWAVHDLGHISQICRVMAKRYRVDVGPWRDYLPVLDR